MLVVSIPPTGIPLPFISAGGTSLIMFMGAMGILFNVANNEKLSYKITSLKLQKKKILAKSQHNI